MYSAPNLTSDDRHQGRRVINAVNSYSKNGVIKGLVNGQSLQKINKTSNMLSQESILSYVEEAEKETLEEKRRLELQEKERKNFVKQVIKNHEDRADVFQTSELAKNGAFQGQTNQNNALSNFTSNNKKQFGKYVDGSSKKDRLEELLEKTEQYTRFILQQNINHHKAQQKKKLLASESLNGNGGEIEKNCLGGKTSVSKRKCKKQGKVQDKSDPSTDEENEANLTRLAEQPSILQAGKLRDYQLDGLNWMISLYETGINGILADEMGLGKTIQTISLICFLREFKQIQGYHLIIMPKSVVGNWMNEFKKWSPQIKVCNLIARKECREEILKNELQPGKFDVCITTFEGIRICMGALQKFEWKYIIIDEAHKIKNEDSQTSQRIRQLRSKNRLLLTGTPLQNNLHELWSLLNFLLPEIFSSSDDFDEWFDLGNKQNAEMTDSEKEKKNDEIIKKLHKILRPFMLRRIKREVEKSLLPKIEMHINVGITEVQKSIYRQLLKKSTIEKGTSTSHYKNILVQLRKVCDHPYLFHGIEADDAPELGDHLIKVCGKMQFLDKLLKKARLDDSQTLIFSGFTSMLNILEDYCRFREYKYCRLDGNTDLDERQSQIDDFTSPGSDKFIFLISTRAGGLGLNLMTANTVILYDSDWNPQMDLQAMDRAHRIGQKKQVRVYRLITKNTMEEKMVEKQTMKLKLDSLIIQKGRMAPKNTGLGKDDLRDMINYGADAIFEIGSNIDDEDIEEIIRNGEEKAHSLNKMAEDIMKEKFNTVNFEMNSCNLYQFEDVDYLKEKRKDQEDLLKKNVIAMLEIETAETTRRKVKKNMAENNLCPNIFGNGNVGVSNEAKKKKLAKVTDYRFFPDPQRLRELIEIEMESRYSGYIQGVEAQIFTPEMKIEKDLIEAKGFPSWDRRDFQKFVQALEIYATDDYQNIAKHMEATKTPEEVKQYALVFFQNVESLHDSAKIIQKIEKAQKNINFNLKAPHLIKQKVLQYGGRAIDEMNLLYATQKSKFFCKESDIQLLCLTDKLGYGNWFEIQRALRREFRCRFDRLFISRSEEEIKKRVIYLVQSLENEQEDNQKKKINDKNQELFFTTQDLNFLDEEINKQMLELEEKAVKYTSNLNNSKLNQYQSNQEQNPENSCPAETKNDIIPSQSTINSNETKNVLESRAIDMTEEDENMSNQRDQYYNENKSEHLREDFSNAKKKIQSRKQKQGSKYKKNKNRESDQGSDDIRIGDRYVGGQGDQSDCIDEELEENELLRREIEGFDAQDAFMQKTDSCGDQDANIIDSKQQQPKFSCLEKNKHLNQNTIDDTIDSNNIIQNLKSSGNIQINKCKKSEAPLQNQKNPETAANEPLNGNLNSSKTAKQSTIADWVNQNANECASSGTKTSASNPMKKSSSIGRVQNLLGQKRGAERIYGAQKNLIMKQANQEISNNQMNKKQNKDFVSEFDIK